MIEESGFTSSEKARQNCNGERHNNFLTTLMTEAKYFEYMLFTLKIMMMNALMRREEFLDRFAFSTDEKSMIFVRLVTCTGTPLSESRDVVNEFLFS